ncbi:MAG: cbb3-type cytochrome c oxidase subunit I [Anaerolineae bacterium]|nr:cbb3-type cytochrome c oxidase subunit I [Anaerolineae bacterium]
MPKLSVWLIRAALVHMGIGFLFGALILHHKGIPIYVWSWRLLNPHVELMIFGWTMQFVMGAAFWILPRFSGAGRYGKVRLGWWSFGLLNLGIVLTASGTWLALDLVSLAGRLAVLSAVLLFVILIYPRVKPLGGYAASQSSLS